VPDVALALDVGFPVAPICDNASSMELINPPPDGGGEDGGATDVTSDVLMAPDWMLLELLVAVSWASQLLMLEMLPIVMPLSPVPGQLIVDTT
jgi:hypothetical protein